jgi:hypothetical protein
MTLMRGTESDGTKQSNQCPTRPRYRLSRVLGSFGVLPAGRIESVPAVRFRGGSGCLRQLTTWEPFVAIRGLVDDTRDHG